MPTATWLKCEKAIHYNLPFWLELPPISLAPVSNTAWPSTRA